MTGVLKGLVVLVVASIVVGCAGVQQIRGLVQFSDEIDRAEFGELWPYTVEHGRLECVENEVFFVVDQEQAYPVNSLARTEASKGFGLGSSEHLDDHAITKPSADGKGLMSNQPIVDAGLRLCVDGFTGHSHDIEEGS